MALSNLERLRLQVADRPRLVLHEIVGIGDGLSLAFQSRGVPVFVNSETVVLVSDSVTQVLTTGADYTFDYDLGLLRLTEAAPTGDRVQVSYRWAAFSDVELEDVLENNGASVRRAAIAVLQMLLADTDRFLKYTLGQEVVDRIGSRDALMALLSELRKYQRGVVSLVLADTAYRECLMAPFIEQTCEAT